MNDNDKQPETADKTDAELSIGERIQKKRKELGLSVEELAALTAEYDYDKKIKDENGLSSQTIYRYEKSEREPAARELKLLCWALNVSPDWLIFGKAWNSKQEADSSLAGDFRNIVKKANDEKSYAFLMSLDDSRNNTHQIKLVDIKNRKK